ncbi:MAG TPA: hypothetical protein VJ884_05775, partial [Salinibacter sp.]|nr:hypothetical protein [Salinibacter sp.]
MRHSPSSLLDIRDVLERRRGSIKPTQATDFAACTLPRNRLRSMDISYRWLNRYVDHDWTPDELA